MKTNKILLLTVLVLALFHFSTSAETSRSSQSTLGDPIKNREEITRLQDEVTRIEALLNRVREKNSACQLQYFSDRLSRITVDINRLDPARMELRDIAAIALRVNELKTEMDKAFRAAVKLESSMRRIEKRIEEIKHAMQDLDGSELEKAENVMQRVSALYGKAREKMNTCEVPAAARIIREIEAIGKRVNAEMKRATGDTRRVEQYIKRNGVILDKAHAMAGNDADGLLAVADALHQRAQDALAAKNIEQANRLAVSCREKLIDLAGGLLSDNEKSSLRKRALNFIADTRDLLAKASVAVAQAGKPELTRLVDKAKADFETALKLHEAGKDARAMELMRSAHRIAQKIAATAAPENTMSAALDRLKKKLDAISEIAKKTTDPEARAAYDRAQAAYEAARKAVEAGDNEQALAEARNAVRLLGKAVHLCMQNDPAARQEVRAEIDRVKTKVEAAVTAAHASRVEVAQEKARQALQYLSKAKAAANQEKFKQALAYLFKAAGLSDRAEAIAQGRDNPDLDEDDSDEFPDAGDTDQGPDRP